MNQLYSIKEFSKLSGLSVRTLQYYDEQGILTPKNKSAAGARYYSNDNLEISQKIITLKYVGFNLKQIKVILSIENFDFVSSLKLQATALQDTIAQLTKGLIIVEESIKHYETNKNIDWDILKQVLQTFQISHSEITQNWSERNFTNAERKLFGSKNFQTTKINYEQKWVKLFTDASKFMQQNKDPLSLEVQELAGKWVKLWFEMVELQYKDKPELADRMWDLIKSGDVPDGLISGYNQQVITYMNIAMTHWESIHSNTIAP